MNIKFAFGLLASIGICLSNFELMRPVGSPKLECRSHLIEASLIKASLIERPVALQDRELARSALGHWLRQFESEPNWLDHAPLVGKTADADLGTRELLQDYRDAWSLVDLEVAVSLNEVLESADPNFLRESRLRLFRFAFGGDRSDLVESLINQEGFVRTPEAFWVDLANFAIEQRKEDLLHLATGRLDAMPANETSLTSSANTPKFFSAGAKLEWVRQSQSGGESEAIKELQKATLALKSDTGAFLGGASLDRIRSNAENYSFLESWKTGPADPDFSDSIHQTLKPLAKLSGQIYWDDDASMPKLHDAVTMPWLNRQLHCERDRVALAMVIRAKGSDLDRARLLALIARNIQSRDSESAALCRLAAEDLLGKAKAIGADDKEIELLLIEAQAELASAVYASGQVGRAMEMIEQLVRSWEASRVDLAKDAELTNGYDMNAFNAMVDAIAAVGLSSNELPDSLVKLITTWVGNVRMSFPGDITSKRCLLSVHDTYRFVDLSAICTVPTMRIREESLPGIYQCIDAKNWAGALNRLQEQMKLQAWMTKTRIGVHHCRKISRLIAEASIEQQGLEKTLAWTAHLSDQSVRMTVELFAILEALTTDQNFVPARNIGLPNSYMPLNLSWIGC